MALTENRDFKRLYASKKHAVTPFFVLYCKKNRLGFNRLGMTTGVKLGCAVKRNRIRRRLKELYRLHEEKFGASFDLVIVGRSRALFAPFAAMEAAFLDGARTVGLIAGSGKKEGRQ